MCTNLVFILFLNYYPIIPVLMLIAYLDYVCTWLSGREGICGLNSAMENKSINK